MPEEEFQQRGELIVVCSGKGGIGRTMLSVNLAIALKKKHRKVCIIDGDIQFGDVNMALDLQSNSTIYNLVQVADQLGEDSLEEYLITHSSGVNVLSAPDRPEYADLITSEVLEAASELLLLGNDYVVVDTEVGLQERSIAMMEKADHILLVTNLEISTLKNTKLMLETYKTLNLFHKVKVIVNRSTMKGIIKIEDLPEILDTETFYCLPNNENVVMKSLNQGYPFVEHSEKSDVAKACCKLADQLMYKNEMMARRKKQSSFLPKLFLKQKRDKGVKKHELI
jgi:pilus assembly protein CpaE